MSTDIENFQSIGEEGGTDALALVSDLMTQSARHDASILQGLYEAEKRDRIAAERRAEIAEERLAQAQVRFADLFRYDPNFWGQP
jgi:hypothetical protein